MLGLAKVFLFSFFFRLCTDSLFSFFFDVLYDKGLLNRDMNSCVAKQYDEEQAKFQGQINNMAFYVVLNDKMKRLFFSLSPSIHIMYYLYTVYIYNLCNALLHGRYKARGIHSSIIASLTTWKTCYITFFFSSFPSIQCSVCL